MYQKSAVSRRKTPLDTAAKRSSSLLRKAPINPRKLLRFDPSACPAGVRRDRAMGKA